MTTKEIFKDKLSDLRKKKGLSQEQLASELNISRTSIGYYEKGERLPDIDVVSKIADFFQVTCDELIKGLKPRNVDINRKLGLSDKAISKLEETNNFHYSYNFDNVEMSVETEYKSLNFKLPNNFGNTFFNLNEALSKFIEDSEFTDFVVALHLYMNLNEVPSFKVGQEFIASPFFGLLKNSKIKGSKIQESIMQLILHQYIDKFSNFACKEG